MGNMKILLYEPDKDTGSLITSRMKREGYDVTWIPDYQKATRNIDDDDYDASLIEIDGKHHYGLNLIKYLFEHGNNPLCVSIYTSKDTSAGFKASKLGSQEIYEVRHGSFEKLNQILQRYRILVHLPHVFKHHSKQFNKAIRDLRNLINHDIPVLIIGESGSGKSFLAEHVHKDGTNRDFHHEEIKCGELDKTHSMEKLLGVARGFRSEIKHDRKGIFDIANDKGLLYLEQIQNLPPELQEVVADVLEQKSFRSVGSDRIKQFKAHVIASCNSLAEINHEGFNRKLYTIISHNVVHVPALKDCLSDIIPNAEQIIEDFCISKGRRDKPILSTEAKIMLYTHQWPVNYRELKGCMENATAHCVDSIIRSSDLNITLTCDESPLPTDERSLIIHFMVKRKGQKNLVAEDLKMSRPTLDKRLKDFDIDYKVFKNARSINDTNSRREGH